MAKFLDKDGLTHFWSKIKTLLAGKSDTTHSHSELNNDLAVNGELYVQSDLNVDGDILVGGQRYADLFAEASHSHDEYFTNTQAQALSDELNTFMNTTVPNTYAKKTDISTAYKARGSVSSVPDPAAEDYAVGDVFNVTAAFTTTDNFVEGAGKQYPAGTNIVIVDVNGAAKWDVLAGFVDLSTFATNSDISDLQGQIDDIEAVTGAIDSITTTEIDTMMDS